MKAIIIVLFAALTGCGRTMAAEAPVAPCTGRVVTVRYGHTPGCDVRPPQRLVVTMPSRWTDHHTERVCDDMGGVLVGTLCRNVDY